MLKVSNVTCSIHRTAILKEVSFTLALGEIVGFVGNNGAGKTTTLEILSTCLQPTSGSITWNDEDIWNSKNFHTELGYVPDQLPLYPNATVYENLLYTSKLRKVDNPKKRVVELLSEFELKSVASTPIRALSKGWKQWVGIAQAWCHKPRLLLLDEPTSGLDPSGRQRFEGWLRNIRSQGTAVFFSSHILSEVEAVSDRVLWIEKGTLIDRRAHTWVIQCTIEKPNPSLLSKLNQIDGVSNVQMDGGCITLSCPPNLRPLIARVLVESGLLEMRRIQ